jgi:hypothetical protein
MMSIRALFLAAFLALAGTALAQAAQAIPVVADEAARILVGNTLVYAKPGRPEEETAVYLLPDGTGRAATRRGGDTGAAKPVQWSILSDQSFCVADVGRQPWDGDCGALSVDGDAVTLAPADGPAWSGKMLQGDAWALDPATTSQARLAGKAAVKALVGNTLVFTPLGGTREYEAFYFLPGGILRRASQDITGSEPDFTHWSPESDERWVLRSEDDHLCLVGDKAGPGKQEYCPSVSISGDLVTLTNEGTDPSHGKLLVGDARNLSPAATAAVQATADALLGNTIVFQIPGRPADEEAVLYFQPGGAGRGKKPTGGSEPIQWRLRMDGTLCIANDGARFHEQDCVAIAITGDAATMTSAGRPVISARILKGNARSL